MKHPEILDHLPPACAWLALAFAGYFTPGELLLFATPLALAGLVEARGWSLLPWRRWLEVLALLLVLGQVFLGAGLLPTTATALFAVAGLRLSLPRGPRERGQILLTGLLTLLAASILSTELSFLLACLAWFGCSLAALLHQTWEESSRHHRGLPPPAPLARVPLWLGATLLVGTLVFLALPRLATGFRPSFWAIGRSPMARSGLSDHLELGNGGPIEPGSGMVLHIQPSRPLDPEPRSRAEAQLGLWKGLCLEGVEGQRWVAFAETPLRQVKAAPQTFWGPDRLGLDLLCAPTALGVLPRPYGRIGIQASGFLQPRPAPGASLRWSRSLRASLPIRMDVIPEAPERETDLSPTRRRLLLQVGDATEAAEAWSRELVPDEPGPEALARRLCAALRGFRYTLENPSGRTPNPLQDFLTRSRAGHCEYFASALCFALRHRGIPARVVIGYRLGPWVPEGGYWVITEAEAHGWVEYLDEGKGVWIPLDPTPAAPPSAWAGEGVGAFLQRWSDALRFRWDRHVLRFNAEDQIAGLGWLRETATSLSFRPLAWRPGPSAVWGTGLALLLGGGLWALHRRREGRRSPILPGRIPELAPLLRVLRRTQPPAPGETLRTWILRLAEQRPERREALLEVLTRAEAQAYAGRPDPELKTQARAEARLWR